MSHEATPRARRAAEGDPPLDETASGARARLVAIERQVHQMMAGAHYPMDDRLRGMHAGIELAMFVVATPNSDGLGPVMAELSRTMCDLRTDGVLRA